MTIEPVQAYLRSVPPNVVSRTKRGEFKITLVGYLNDYYSQTIKFSNHFTDLALAALSGADVKFNFEKAPEGVHGSNPSHLIKRCPALIIKHNVEGGLSYILEGIDKIEKFAEQWRSCEDEA